MRIKRKINLTEFGKNFLIIVAIFTFVISATLFYVDRLNKINSGKFIVECDCNMDK